MNRKEMRKHHKITLATLATVIAIIAGLFTIIEKTPAVLAVIKTATASEAPDTLEVKRSFAGVPNKNVENVQQPKGAK